MLISEIPLAEQGRIVDLASSVDQRIECGQQELQRLQMLKQGLADDLLSGKVRVGEVA
ncbi:hypothetical protein OHT20_20755 [Streptomyces caniferus]|uniref:hypothetical protein n=1 Tax=Streptomyces caniferus TaxID=285557 RepID=UPI002E2A4F89|nr:hypothetical protein [Streptomyces caniferus]